MGHWLLNHRKACFPKKSFGSALPCSSLGSRLNLTKWMHMRKQQNVAEIRRSEESHTRCSPKPSTDLCPTNALPAVFTPRLACCRAPSFALQEVISQQSAGILLLQLGDQWKFTS